MEEKAQKKTRRSFREVGMVGVLVALVVIFSLLNNKFLTVENIMDLLRNTAILGILAVGMMMIIITDGIDLSVGALLALSGMLAGMTVQYFPGLPLIVPILVGVAVGLGGGAINGLLVAKGKIIPIIATLGMMNVYRGLTYTVADGAWVSAYQMTDQFKAMATSGIGPINNLIIIWVVVLVVFYYFLTFTRQGRYIYAVGSNREASSITGIKRDKTVILAYALAGLLIGLSGVLWVSKFASAQGDTATGYEMNVIAACVLGGVSISGGSGKISGLILGVLLLGMIDNALPLIPGLTSFWQMFIRGCIILGAVLSNVIVKRRSDALVLRRREI